MPDENQASPRDAHDPAPPETLEARPISSAAAETEPQPGFGAEGRGLSLWLAILLGGGAGGLLLGMQEMAALVAVAGLFVAAQAADLDARWRGLYYPIAWIVPVGGAAAATMIAFAVFRSDLAGSARFVALGTSTLAAGLSLLLMLRPVSDPLAWALFREPPSHTLRLTARMAVLVVLLALPGWFALRFVMSDVFLDPSVLIEQVSFGGELAGYVLLALASVGFLVRRDFRAALERLGIRPIAAGQLAIVALGVVALYALNTGADWVERMFFHDLWDSDQRFNEALAGGLGPGRVLMLALSAGIGEEITLRGALQPKLGLVLTSLLFAALHVQYSWFGILVIFLLAMILGTIRMKSNTSAAIAVHVVYDVAAVLSFSAPSQG